MDKVDKGGAITEVMTLVGASKGSIDGEYLGGRRKKMTDRQKAKGRRSPKEVGTRTSHDFPKPSGP
jgi:hypothetical protein